MTDLNKHLWRPTLSRRIRDMAARWLFDHDELTVCLHDAVSDPASWYVRVARDEAVNGRGAMPARV
jgi:hypothetical protein